MEVDAREVLEQYSRLLAKPSNRLIRDEAELPYPKPIIKAVLIGALDRVTDERTRERLKIAYQSIADFQPLTDEERQALSIMATVDEPAPWASDQFRRQIDQVIAYGPIQQTVARRMVAEAEALFADVRDR